MDTQTYSFGSRDTVPPVAYYGNYIVVAVRRQTCHTVGVLRLDPTPHEPMRSGVPDTTLRQWLAYREVERGRGNFRDTLTLAQWRTEYDEKLLRERLVHSSKSHSLTLDNSAQRISSEPAKRKKQTGRRATLPTAYKGTTTRDGFSQDATRSTLKRTPLEHALPLSDVAHSHEGDDPALTHIEPTRSPYVLRYPLGDVSESATLHHAHTQPTGRNRRKP